jgi:hypothetical protein
LGAPPFNDASGLQRRQRIALSLAAEAEIACGFGDGAFRPQGNATYRQAIKICEWSRWLGYRFRDLEKPIDFYNIALNSTTFDSEAIHGVFSGLHKMDDPISKKDFAEMLEYLSENSFLSPAFGKFHEPQSYLECAEIFAGRGAYSPYAYFQYPLLADELTYKCGLQRDESILNRQRINPYASCKHAIFETPYQNAEGMRRYEIAFWSPVADTGGNAYALSAISVFVNKVNGRYRIFDIIQ